MLQDRWALVMEYAEGRSVAHLLKRNGALPPSVCLDIVREISRVLERVWNHQGPSGKPLRLVHRDLKPGNVQIDSQGGVKVLDFGIARAEFAAREAHTTGHIGGTPGYIAPERLYGHELPAGDIFSLGVVLRELVTNERPAKELIIEDLSDGQYPGVAPIRELWTHMMDQNPGNRPTAREVEKRCRHLQAEYRDPSLRDWAEDRIDAAPRYLESDELVGITLSQTVSAPRLSSGSVSNIPSAVETEPSSETEALDFEVVQLATGQTEVPVDGHETLSVMNELPSTPPSTTQQPPPALETVSTFQSPPEPTTVPVDLPPKRGAIWAIAGAAVVGFGAIVAVCGGWQVISGLPGWVPEQVVSTEEDKPVSEDLPKLEVGKREEGEEGAEELVPEEAPAPKVKAPPVDKRSKGLEQPKETVVEVKPEVEEEVAETEPVEESPAGPKGTLKVNAVPVAKLSIDGEAIGETFWEGSITPGPHEITLETPEGSTTQKVIVYANDSTTFCWDFASNARCPHR
jgi:hypothetical protein